jgi:hypothetical protein
MFKPILLGIAAVPAVLFAVVATTLALMQPPRLPVPPRGAFTIKDVTLVNPGVARQAHVDIQVAAGRVLHVGPTSSRPAPGDLQCPGCTAMPGLMDMHAHLPPRAAIGNDRLFSLLFLANGVTTLRELGSADGGAYAIRDEIAAGRYPGPRVISCGRVLDGDPPTRSNNVIVRTPAEGRREVDKAVAHGARCIKLYNMLSRPVVLAIAAEAARKGVPIVAHVPHSISLLDAPFIADVQHLTGVPLTSDAQKLGVDDYLNADFAALSDARILEVTNAALRQGTIHTPALVNEDSRRTLGDPERFPPDPQLAVLPDFWTAVWRALWSPPNTGQNEAIYSGFLSRDRAAVNAFLKSGVTVYAGTDTLMPFVAPGASLKSEVRNLAALGLTPEAALATATTSPGRFWKDQTYGRVAAGLPADINLYAQDPTASLDGLDTLEWVVADGRAYRKDQLDAWVQRYRRHFHSQPYSAVMNAIASLIQGGYGRSDGGG